MISPRSCETSSALPDCFIVIVRRPRGRDRGWALFLSAGWCDSDLVSPSPSMPACLVEGEKKGETSSLLRSVSGQLLGGA